MERKFKIYWRGGKTEVVRAEKIDDAIKKAGGTRADLDYYTVSNLPKKGPWK